MAWLRQRVAEAYPEAVDPKVPDFTRVTLLRYWVWSHVRYAGGPGNLLDQNPQISWYKLDAPAIFQLFAEDRGGVYCGGTAWSLFKVYEAFGFNTWIVNSGSIEGQVTHVVTLVEINHDGKKLINLQDAYFNYGLVEASTGQPMDYFDLLARLRRKDHTSVHMQEPDNLKLLQPWPATLVPAERASKCPPEKFARNTWSVLEDNYTLTILPDGRFKFVSPRTLGKFLRTVCPARYLPWLIAQGHAPEVVYLYLYPFQIYPSGEELLRKAHAIIGHKLA